MYPPSQILRQALVDDSVIPDSQAATWHCWLNYMPDDGITNDTMAIYDTTGVSQGRVSSGHTLFYRGIQLLFAGLSYPVVYSKIARTNNQISFYKNKIVTFENTEYEIITINQQSDLIALGKQDNRLKNWMFSVNYLLVLRDYGGAIKVTSDNFISVSSDGYIPVYIN